MLIVLVPSGDARAQAPSIFREISVAPFGTILLGAPFTHRDLASEQVSANIFRLPAGFGDTRNITVVTDPSGIVRTILFEYQPAASLEDMADQIARRGTDYWALLGVNRPGFAGDLIR